MFVLMGSLILLIIYTILLFPFSSNIYAHGRVKDLYGENHPYTIKDEKKIKKIYKFYKPFLFILINGVIFNTIIFIIAVSHKMKIDSSFFVSINLLIIVIWINISLISKTINSIKWKTKNKN